MGIRRIESHVSCVVGLCRWRLIHFFMVPSRSLRWISVSACYSNILTGDNREGDGEETEMVGRRRYSRRKMEIQIKWLYLHLHQRLKSPNSTSSPLADCTARLFNASSIILLGRPHSAPLLKIVISENKLAKPRLRLCYTVLNDDLFY
jgi:hypothetical protein